MDQEFQQKTVFKDQKTQQELNTPLKDSSGLSDADKEFLKLLISYINEGKIDLYKPSSIINSEVYNKIDEQKQGKADLEAVNLLSTIRDIKGLYDAGYGESFQIQNLVERLRATKERLEAEGGNLFII
ncbi:hypothetical protein HY605_03105 [Candidatus Peregrinibacteria bacterium]|nr:hypothetical protein [Candidatus Peregrinibacteria bacterium]